MCLISTLVFCIILTSSGAVEVKFPPWFQFGVSTAAYQVEGGWNVSDKGESIWDHFVHSDPTVIEDLTNGDVACDSYRLWERDVEMAAEIGLNFYRFSISWPRLLPTGFSNKVSEDGKRYYNGLIDGLLEKGIEPVVTLYHWDLPQNLQELGGWTNPFITSWFKSYASVVFSLFADRVKTWITINEPLVFCDLAYSTGTLAPGVVDALFATHLCTRHALLAHAEAWRVYDEQYKPLYHGKVSISNHMIWFHSKTREDSTLARLVGDYIVKRSLFTSYLLEASFKEGYETSRMPDFSNEEIAFIKGTYDFFALNYYTCRIVRRVEPGEKVNSYFSYGVPELSAIFETKQGFDVFIVCPKGLRALLSWIKKQYGDVEVFISENGFSTPGAELQDPQRITFIRDHLEQILLSIEVDGVNVTGYTYWSIMDNLEWASGYGSKFGLYAVDFNSPKRNRTPRISAHYYSNIIRNHAIRLNASTTEYYVNDKK